MTECLNFISLMCVLMSGSSHTLSVRNGFEYLNCNQTLNEHLLFATLLWQINSKLN